MTELNPYIPFLSEITEVIKHTEIEYTFRMTYRGDVKPGQFFRSLPAKIRGKHRFRSAASVMAPSI